MANLEEQLEACKKELETYRRKTAIIEHALTASAGAYYCINITKDIVPGTMYQVIDGMEYSINEKTGLPENCRFTDVAEYWGKGLPVAEQAAFFDFFSISNFKKCYENGDDHISYKYWTKNALGEPMLAEQHIVMYRDECDGDLMAVSYVLDLTAAHNLRSKDAALELAEAANRSKTVFLNNISHDIRTPMNAIIGFTTLAAAHMKDTPVLENYLKKIMISSNHLLSLINDVLDMSRIESGRMKIEENPNSLSVIMHDLRNILQADINAKRLNFLIDTVDVVNERIICDKLRLNQVLINCASNAIKFTAPGGTVGIKVIQKGSADENGYAAFNFIISDTGIGMSQDFADHIFEPFSREETSTVSGIPGTGLGMAITKNIVDLMGGRISVKSEPGKGSEFTVALRFRICGESEKSADLKMLKGLRALVADDNMDTCTSVCRMLERIGLEPEWTLSGKEAVYRTKYAYEGGKSFNIFIIDWLMPDMNGVEVVRRIRNEIGDETPIIILSAYDWSEIEEEAIEAGVTAFCSKPIFQSELLEIITKYYSDDKEKEDKKNEVISTVSDLAGKKILLAEDNELNQEIAAAILEEAGFSVDIVSDGDEAVEKIRCAEEGQYDVVLMDVQMPNMDGYTATREIRALDGPMASVPIVAMTANAFDDDRTNAKNAGMNGYVAKPINTPVLMKTLTDILK